MKAGEDLLRYAYLLSGNFLFSTERQQDLLKALSNHLDVPDQQKFCLSAQRFQWCGGSDESFRSSVQLPT